MAIAFALIVYNVYYSIRYSSRNIGADPWDARTLEWATHTPVPEYNFAIAPEVEFNSKHYGMRRKKDMNYSQGSMKRFICQITVVFHLSMSCYLLCMGIFVCICYVATADYRTIGFFAVWCFVHLKKIMEDIFLLKKLKKLKQKLRGAK